MSLIDFRHVNFSYDGENMVFYNVSFDLSPGSFHYLTGPSGAGKSSLIRLMYGDQFSYGGQIYVLGRDLKRLQGDDIARLRQDMGVVFQDFYLLNHLTILDNVAMPLRLVGQSWSKARKAAQTILDWIGLDNHKDFFPKALSGGQRQRVVIARAIINRPKILIADEPTGNLDHENAVKLLYLFEELNKQGTTVLFATHNKELLSAFPHPQLHLERGILTFYDRPPCARRDTPTPSESATSSRSSTPSAPSRLSRLRPSSPSQQTPKAC